MINTFCKLVTLASAGLLISCQSEKKSDTITKSEKQKPNVLFIAVDDLRPELNCYGANHIKSENIDKLAAEGIQFNRAYCNIPVSGASRASMLTGTRPRRNSFRTWHDTITEQRPNIPTLGKYFKDYGYYTFHNSKVMHIPHDAQGSWDEEWWPKSNGSYRDYLTTKNLLLDTEQWGNWGPAFEIADVEDNEYKDGKTADKTIADLKRMSEEGKSFFMAVGFQKPHLPFNAPKKYWDMYNPDEIKLPENNYRPKNAPDEAMHKSGELRNYYGIPKEGPLTDEDARNLIHGYYACVSYIDVQIGKVLNALNEFGLSENTIIVLWGDHGWNLREHGLWCKHCNFNTSLNAPLIIKVPGITGGRKTDEITEFVDVYPTLCELVGIPVPDHVEGNSLVKVLKDKNGVTDGLAICRWKEGFTIIKENYFYTEWSDNLNQGYSEMLFDHSKDPNENINISVNAENKDLIQQLKSELHANWGEKFNE